MFSHSAALRTVTVLVIATLLLNTLAPVASAQDASGNVYLPAVSGGQPASAGDPLPPGRLQYYRTSVEVSTTAQWQSLARIDPVIVERGDNWALLLVDDQQLADLARLRFNPANTNALTTLEAAARSQGAHLPSALAVLTGQVHTAAQLAAADQQAMAAQRTALRTLAKALTTANLSALAAAASVDTDADGLTDDQEFFWCTDPARADSDYDSTKDGLEVVRLKDWMNNKTYTFPSTGKPFLGWPPQKTNCYDDDQDSVPDLAELNELGLSPARESTDRDKFDDGQELFGQTYCTGQGGFCSYGPLPRNEDWGVIFAEMPSWVKAPGNHPLVAAYPVPEFDVVESSLAVELVTEITTDHTISNGTQQTYSTAKTEGQSSSVANTETWNSWEEVSEATESMLRASTTAATEDVKGCDWWSQARGKCRTMSEDELMGFDPSVCWGTDRNNDTTGKLDLGWELGPKVTAGAEQTFGTTHTEKGPTDLGCKAYLGRLYQNLSPGELDDVRNAINFYNDLDTGVGTQRTEPISDTLAAQVQVNNVFDTSEIVAGLSGMQTAYLQSGKLIANKLYDIASAISAPRFTRTDTHGSSRGGSQTLEHTSYEEQTVTNSQALSNEESWGTATAVNSAHAADLWFTYRIRNVGTEYAREITNLAFNIYVGDNPDPVTTYYVAPDLGPSGKFVNFMPSEEHTYTAHRIPLSLEQLKAVDLGGPIRIVVEDFSYGIDELFYSDAANAGIVIAVDDGTSDGNAAVETFMIPTWGSEKALNVLARYFPHETDPYAIVQAIWTPEYRSDTPGWCQSPLRPVDSPSKVVWCKHTLSTADWWNIYSDGFGGSSEGFQDMPAVAGATALFRFNQDSDLDGFSDRSEAEIGTDPKDAASYPQPEIVAGIHNVRSGNTVTSTLSLLNSGFYDAYGVEAVMVAPDDSITVRRNTVGGSGRVKDLKQVIVGSRLELALPLPPAWSQAGHAAPAIGGYYTGERDASYTFTVSGCGAGSCTVGTGSWTLGWNGGGSSGTLNFGSGYSSPSLLAVGQGMMLALSSGSVQNGETFTVNALAPVDTFQYAINREPYTQPIVIVAYNDPQGNHRLVLPAPAMNLASPTEDLRTYAGTMLHGVGVDLVTSSSFAAGRTTMQVLSNNPSASTLQNARLIAEIVNMTGTIVSKVSTRVNLSPGPTYTPVTFDTGSFAPPYNSQEDYVVMVFLTDYQGNILDTTGRPFSSFQADPLPKLAYDPAALTWNFGTVPQGSLIKRPLALANTGFGALSVYLGSAPGLTLSRRVEQVGGADLSNYELQLSTGSLPVGTYDQSVTIATSDPTQPLLTLRVLGTVTAASGDSAGGTVQRPLDALVSVQGDHGQGEWYNYSHSLGPDAQTLHPVKVYSQSYAVLHGVGRYATDFSQGTASSSMFGDGRDGTLTVAAGQTVTLNQVRTAVTASGISAAPANTTGFDVGDLILLHQTQRTANVGVWEYATIAAINGPNSWTLAQHLRYSYDGASGRAQAVKVPQYQTVTVQAGGILNAPAWDGTTGGILVVKASDSFTVQAGGVVETNGKGFAGGQPRCVSCYAGIQGEGHTGPGIESLSANGNGGGAGQSDPSPSGGSGNASGGAGGGHANAGTNGVSDTGTRGGTGGAALGAADLATIYFGGGGGAGGAGDNAGRIGQAGGSGGGILMISARQVSANGSVTSNGVSLPGTHDDGGGGGGAGGAVLLRAATMNAATSAVSALGGAGGIADNDGDGGAGSAGRIRIEYCESIAAGTNPAASTQKVDCYIVEQVESVPYSSGRLNLPETFTGGRTYAAQYGRKLDFAAAGQQLPSLRLPAGLQSSTNLQLLASGLATSTSASIDVGNDGSVEWSTTVANNSTTDLTDLSAAFNAYWAASGAPATGTIDVPIKVTSGGAGQFLLTNLRTTSAASRLRHLYLPAQTYTKFLLDLSVGDAGQAAVTAAVDLGDNGSIDWNTSAAGPGPARWTTGHLAAALNAYLVGKSGMVDVPLRIYVSPSGSAALNGYAAAAAPLADLTASTPTVGVTAAVAGAGTSAVSVTEGATVRVTTTLRNNGSGASGPLTAAFFAAVPNWGDWYLGSVYVANLAAGASAPTALDWNTLNFGGVTAVKVVVNPYGTTGETNLANNTVTLPITVVPLHPAPMVNFSATPVTGGAPLSVSFTDLTTGDVTSRSWQFGDGGTATVANPSHTYTSMGVYTVTLSAEGPGGSDWERKTAFITVTDQPVAPTAAFVASPTSGTVPLTVQFTDQSSGTITGRQWDFGDGQTSTQQNPSHTFTGAGSYAVSLSVSGPGGAHSKQMPAYITVTPPAPVAAFGAEPSSGTAPLAVQFTDSSTGVITGRSWNFGDGGTSTAQNPSHSYTAAGSYTVALTVTGPGGSDVETKAAYITVSAAPPPPPTAPVAGFSANLTAGAAPLTVQFTDASTGTITGRTWSFGDGGTSTAQNPSHTYTAAGVYDVSLAVTGSGGSDTEAKTAYIQVAEIPPGSSVLMSPGSGGTLQLRLGAATVILLLPPGAVDEPVLISAAEVAVPPATGGLRLAGKAFVITAKTQNGAAVTSFKLPYTLVIKYADADVAGIDESRLQLHYWSDAQGAWIAVPGTIDTTNNSFNALLDHLTLFALLERAAAREEHLYLPSLKR